MSIIVMDLMGSIAISGGDKHDVDKPKSFILDTCHASMLMVK